MSTELIGSVIKSVIIAGVDILFLTLFVFILILIRLKTLQIEEMTRRHGN